MFDAARSRGLLVRWSRGSAFFCLLMPKGELQDGAKSPRIFAIGVDTARNYTAAVCDFLKHHRAPGHLPGRLAWSTGSEQSAGGAGIRKVSESQ